MNGPVKMYATRQIVRHDLKVSLPTCMYKLKNIHEIRKETAGDRRHVGGKEAIVDISEQSFVQEPEMTALLERQERILKQLDDLRQQMVTLKSDLGSKTEPTHSTCPLMKITQVPLNMVINASPQHPPYFLLLVRKLWSSFVHLRITTHVHSTVSLVSNITDFTTLLENYITQQDQPVVDIKLIWKDVGPNTELIVACLPIAGEANILRFLARINPSLLPYENLPLETVNELDSILDVCYILARTKTKSKRSSLIQGLSKKLAKSKWLCDQSQMTIADVAGCSVLKQVGDAEVNQTTGKWMQRCFDIL